jgi:hypothetical protein
MNFLSRISNKCEVLSTEDRRARAKKHAPRGLSQASLRGMQDWRGVIDMVP